MTNYIDAAVIILYFIIILLAGYFIGKKHANDSANDFLTGGHSMNWFQTGLTLIAMSIDTGIMGVAGVGFVWGMALQPNATNLWITAPVAAMFLIPIYWRTKIITTPELLEKRFNVTTRAFFSVVMSFFNVIVLGSAIYLGGIIISNMFNINIFMSSGIILIVVAIYVIMGGMKTVLAINVYQSIFIMLTLFVVGIMCVHKTGGIVAFMNIDTLNPAGNPLPSTQLPFDWDVMSEKWYPNPGGLTWAIFAGMAWIACNFSMVQRLLAAKNEEHAQKAMLFTGAGHVFTYIFAYAIGVSMAYLMPDAKPDEAYMHAIMNYFPVGVRGLLIAGLIASLISTIDGLLTSSSALITQDIYLRFINPKASDQNIKVFTRIVQAVVIGIALFVILPISIKQELIIKFTQSLVADIFGVVIALFLVGIFSKRATPKAATFAMFTGLALSISLHFFTEINFVYVGSISFIYTVVAILVLSLLEKPIPEIKLRNLTVSTMDNIKGPFVGLNAWPNLWKWIIGIMVGWSLISYLWEWLIAK